MSGDQMGVYKAMEMLDGIKSGRDGCHTPYCRSECVSIEDGKGQR